MYHCDLASHRLSHRFGVTLESREDKSEKSKDYLLRHEMPGVRVLSAAKVSDSRIVQKRLVRDVNDWVAVQLA